MPTSNNDSNAAIHLHSFASFIFCNAIRGLYKVNKEGNEKEMAIHFQIKIPYSIDKRET